MSLKPLGGFLTAIDCMCESAWTGWDDVFAQGIRLWADGYEVEIDVEGFQDPTAPLPLRTSHIVLALYETVLAMSTDFPIF